MALLSNIFGGGDDSSNDSSSDLLGIVDLDVAGNLTVENYSEDTDDDGTTESSYDATSIGGDLDVGAILSGMTDFMSNSSSDEGLLEGALG